MKKLNIKDALLIAYNAGWLNGMLENKAFPDYETMLNEIEKTLQSQSQKEVNKVINK